ncbi:hypothetical protein CWI38_1529p0010, partial [Hamiltosporidium tvaerminnensis]
VIEQNKNTDSRGYNVHRDDEVAIDFSFFIMMTCNPKYAEICENLDKTEKRKNRPD